jgi:succinyl-diaminopimelate desuccinylase
MTIEEARLLIEGSVQVAEALVPGTVVSFRQINNNRPPVEADVADPFLQTLAQCIRDETKVAEPLSVFPAYTDASVVQSRTGNTTSVVFGPGLLAQAHTADEYVSCTQIHMSYNILVKLIGRICF